MTALAFARRALKETFKRSQDVILNDVCYYVVDVACCQGSLVYFKDWGGDGWEFRSNKGKHSRQNNNREHRTGRL